MQYVLQDFKTYRWCNIHIIYISFHLGSLSLLRCSALRFNIADEVSHHPTIRDSLGEEFTTIIPSPSADSLVCCQKDDPRKSRAECTRRHTKQCEKMYQTKYICVSLFIFLKNNIKGLFFFDQKLLWGKSGNRGLLFCTRLWKMHCIIQLYTHPLVARSSETRQRHMRHAGNICTERPYRTTACPPNPRALYNTYILNFAAWRPSARSQFSGFESQSWVAEIEWTLPLRALGWVRNQVPQLSTGIRHQSCGIVPHRRTPLPL